MRHELPSLLEQVSDQSGVRRAVDEHAFACAAIDRLVFLLGAWRTVPVE